MARSDTPQTPQTPQTPPHPPDGSTKGTTSVTVERTVTNIDSQDAPRPPQPPASTASPAPTVTSTGSGLTTVSGASVADAIRPDTQFQIHIGISTILIDNETIIHDHLRNANYRLNPTGSFIWSRIAPQISFGDLLAAIRATYDAVPETSDRMVAEFLADLVGRGVLVTTTLALR